MRPPEAGTTNGATPGVHSPSLKTGDLKGARGNAPPLEDRDAREPPWPACTAGLRPTLRQAGQGAWRDGGSWLVSDTVLPTVTAARPMHDATGRRVNRMCLLVCIAISERAPSPT